MSIIKDGTAKAWESFKQLAIDLGGHEIHDAMKNKVRDTFSKDKEKPTDLAIIIANLYTSNGAGGLPIYDALFDRSSTKLGLPLFSNGKSCSNYITEDKFTEALNRINNEQTLAFIVALENAGVDEDIIGEDKDLNDVEFYQKYHRQLRLLKNLHDNHISQTLRQSFAIIKKHYDSLRENAPEYWAKVSPIFGYIADKGESSFNQLKSWDDQLADNLEPEVDRLKAKLAEKRARRTNRKPKGPYKKTNRRLF